MIFASGRMRGRFTFSPTDAPLRFTAPGGTAVRLAKSSDVRVERGPDRVSRGHSFDIEAFPHVLHLKNGEVLPCRVENSTARWFVSGRPSVRVGRSERDT